MYDITMIDFKKVRRFRSQATHNFDSFLHLPVDASQGPESWQMSIDQKIEDMGKRKEFGNALFKVGIAHSRPQQRVLTLVVLSLAD